MSIAETPVEKIEGVSTITTFRFGRLGFAAVFALGLGAGTANAEDVPQARIDARHAALAKYEDPYVAVRDLYVSTAASTTTA